jgi:hypothetical protein
MADFMRENLITIAGLIGLVGCSSIEDQPFEKTERQTNQSQEIYFGPKPNTIPFITKGPYEGMGYLIINQDLAKKENINPLIEIRDRNSGKSLKVVYNKDGSIKSHTGNLEYIPEAVEKIRLEDKSFKNNFSYKIK